MEEAPVLTGFRGLSPRVVEIVWREMEAMRLAGEKFFVTKASQKVANELRLPQSLIFSCGCMLRN